MKKKLLIPALTIFLVMLIDQVLKIYIKLNYHYQENTQINSWFQLFFIENEGMAFGLKWGGSTGKFFLTIFRLLFVSALGYYLYRLIKKQVHSGYIFSMSLIFAGALGNIIDSVFYGVIFSESSVMQLAQLFPAKGGYASLFQGKVVDMLYFPIWHGILPNWIPFLGGKEFSFFDPIFNIADAAITGGVLIIIIFQGRFFKKKKEVIDELVIDPAAPVITAFENESTPTSDPSSGTNEGSAV